MANASEFYGVFLIVEMGRDMGIFNRELETDLTWEQASALYEEYEASEFNVDTQGEYMCIHDFMETKKFDPNKALLELYKEFDGQEFNGLVFHHNEPDGTVYLTSPNFDALMIFCGATLSEEEHSIQFDIQVDGGSDKQLIFGVSVPTNEKEFAEFKDEYIAKLCEILSNTATVSHVELDVKNKEYTVVGYLIPKQTIKFENYSDWDCIKDHNGNAILDCQIDFDEGFQFQYCDLNFDIDSGQLGNSNGEVNYYSIGDFAFSTKNNVGFDVGVNFGNSIGTQTLFVCGTEEEAMEFVRRLKAKDITLMDSEWQGGYDEIEFIWFEPTTNPIESEVEDGSIDKLIEIRGFKYKGIHYEVHVDATNGREIFDIFAESGEVTQEIRTKLNEVVSKIDN